MKNCKSYASELLHQRQPSALPTSSFVNMFPCFIDVLELLPNDKDEELEFIASLKVCKQQFETTQMRDPRLLESPGIEYFLTTLQSCSTSNDSYYLEIANKEFFYEDVKEVLDRLSRGRPVDARLYNLNVSVMALKEFLRFMSDGLFEEMSEEFIKISHKSSLQITIIYLHSIIHELPCSIRDFAHSLCRTLKHLIHVSSKGEGNRRDKCSDILLQFTPVIFTNICNDASKFLNAARSLLVMIDYCDKIFSSKLPSNDEGMDEFELREEESFFKDILDSLQSLEATLACEDSGIESESEDSYAMTKSNLTDANHRGSEQMSHNISTPTSTSSNRNYAVVPNFYHFAYVDLDEPANMN